MNFAEVSFSQRLHWKHSLVIKNCSDEIHGVVVHLHELA